MKKHVEEIKGLLKKSDAHFVTETGDLLILCLEMIKETGRSPDAVLDKCYGRYRRKLGQLISEMKDKEQGG